MTFTVSDNRRVSITDQQSFNLDLAKTIYIYEGQSAESWTNQLCWLPDVRKAVKCHYQQRLELYKILNFQTVPRTSSFFFKRMQTTVSSWLTQPVLQIMIKFVPLNVTCRLNPKRVKTFSHLVQTAMTSVHRVKYLLLLLKELSIKFFCS